MNVRPSEEHLVTGYSGRLLVLLALGTMTTNAITLVFAPLLQTIIDALSISPSKAGFALTLLAGLRAVCRFPGGRFADRLSHKTVLVISLGLLAIGSALIIPLQTYRSLLVGAATIGAGAGLYQTATASQLSALFVERRGQAFGVYEASITLGGLLASGLAAVALALAMWRAPFVLLFGLFVGLLILLHVHSEESYALHTVDLGVKGIRMRLLNDPALRILLLSASVFSFVWQGALNFLPTFIQETKDVSPTLASYLLGLFFVIGIGSTLSAGTLGDRFGHLLIAFIATIFSSFGLVILIISTSLFITTVAVVVFAVGLTAFWPMMTTSIMNIVPDSDQGGDYGALSTVFVAVGSIGPFYVGFAAERASYLFAFSGFLPCLVVTTAGLGWLIHRA
jgi:MFS family permease